MIKGDMKYREHFYHMVTTGLACGLGNPIEWVCSYERCIGEPYDKIPEVREFCNIAIRDLFETIHCGIPEIEITNERIREWVEGFYSKGDECCGGCNKEE